MKHKDNNSKWSLTSPPLKGEGFFAPLDKKEKIEQKSSKEKKNTKEVRFSISISDNDLKTKINMVQKFLKQGDNVLIKVILKGRESVKYELGYKRMESILNYLKESYGNKSDTKSEKNAIQCTIFS